MSFFKKPPKKDSFKGQLRELIHELGSDAKRGVGELTKEAVKGVTMLPYELVGLTDGSSGGSNNSWEKEWLKSDDQGKDKPPLAEKEGAHSKINPEQFSKKNDQTEIERLQRQIASSLNQTYSRASSSSEYGQAQAQKWQHERKSAYDKIWEERDQARQRTSQQAAPQANLAGTGSKRQAGDWKHGAKRKRGPSPQELNRSEFAGKGKQ